MKIGTPSYILFLLMWAGERNAKKKKEKKRNASAKGKCFVLQASSQVLPHHHNIIEELLW